MADVAVRPAAGRLPAEVTSFVGRRQELSEVRRLLEAARLVTLLGAGGVGKTRLALRTAADVRRAFPDGVCFVDLATVLHAEVLAQCVADAMDLGDQSARDPLDALADHLAGRRVLLVLDTCEHLVDACAMLVELLLRAGPGVRVLATSRQPLDIPGEHTMTVAPLGVTGGEDEAVALFAERARAVIPGFTVDETNRADVVRLCHRLEGIPLAIELAAVRLRALPMERIVARLGDRFTLTGERRTSQARHQTLRAAIQWSHELCGLGERTAWARLSVFAGGFDLSAAEEVCAGEGLATDQVLDLVVGLVDKSVLVREPDGRYRMLDTIREYGAERLAECTEAEVVRRRYRDHYLRRVEQAARELAGPAQRGWFAWEQSEQANVRDVLDHAIRTGDVATALRMLESCGLIWFGRGRLREIRMWGARVLELTGGDPAGRFRAVLVVAFTALIQGDLPAARRLLDEVRARLTPAQRTYLTQLDGTLAFLDDDLARGRALLGRAWEEHRRADARDVLALSTGLFATAAHISQGDLDGAQAVVEEFIAACREAGEEWCLAHALWARAGCRLIVGKPAGAQDDIRTSLRIAARLDARITVTSGLELSAACAYELGDPHRAGVLFGAADELRRSQGMAHLGGHLSALWELAGVQIAQALGPDAFAAARAEGERLSYSDRIAFALDEDPPAEAAPGTAGTSGTTDPAGQNGRLTRREREIAALIAEGLSNREIAARLVIAKRTVDSHVEHILAKLGFSSRAQVAAWVSRS